MVSQGWVESEGHVRWINMVFQARVEKGMCGRQINAVSEGWVESLGHLGGSNMVSQGWEESEGRKVGW